MNAASDETLWCQQILFVPGHARKFGRYILDINNTTGVLNTGECMRNFKRRITRRMRNTMLNASKSSVYFDEMGKNGHNGHICERVRILCFLVGML